MNFVIRNPKRGRVRVFFILYVLVLSVGIAHAPVVWADPVMRAEQTVLRAETKKLVFPTTIIRDSLLDANGIGVYLGYGKMESGGVPLNGGVAILHSVFTKNGEAVRLLGAPSTIQGNEFRENLIGIKIQKELVYRGQVITFEVTPSQIALNNFRANQEFAVLNTTSVPFDLNGNFWGDERGPAFGDASYEIQLRAAAAIWLMPQRELTVAVAAATDYSPSLWGQIAISLTIRALFSDDLSLTLAFSEPAAIGQLVGQRERVKGPAVLQSWLESPVVPGEKSHPEKEKEDKHK